MVFFGLKNQCFCVILRRWITQFFLFCKGFFYGKIRELRSEKYVFKSGSKKDLGERMAEGDSSNIFVGKNDRGILERIGRKKVFFITLFFLVIVAASGYWFFRNWAASQGLNTSSQVSEKAQPSQSTKIGTQTLSTERTPLFGDANYQSENFRVGEVAIGGEAEFLLTEDTPDSLEITSIRGESFTEKNKPEVKLVLSWRTNKLAKSDIDYSKGVGQAKKTMSEEDYSLSHSMVIPGLDQASTYVYSITSSDRFGNTVTSDSHAVYTGSKTVSLFDLIAGAIGDVFGWAVKKN